MTNKHQKIELNAAKREAIGGRLNSLRKSGFVPAILYGKNQEPLALQIPVKDFAKAFESAGESTLVYINVDGQAYPVIIHDVSRDPVTDDVIHADFYKVRLDEKIKTNVPVEFVGEASAVKDLGGIFVRNVNELEVEALPQDLPHELTIDISVLKLFGDKVTIGDIKKSLGSGVVLTAEDDEAIIATVQEPMSEEEFQKELEAPTETAEDVKIIEKEKAEEEVPEEGEVQASPQEESAEKKA